jgi:hypothetical protein
MQKHKRIINTADDIQFEIISVVDKDQKAEVSGCQWLMPVS